MSTRVYLAARSEDQAIGRRLMGQLLEHGISNTARWLALADLSNINQEHAQLCLDDITIADAFVLLQSPIAYRDTTGGHHVETGAALILGKPIILIGQPRNVFHGMGAVTVVARDITPADLAFVIHSVVTDRARRTA